MGEDDVGQALDPVQVLIPEDDRRAALIGRSHHQRYRAQPIEEQMMQRRIGQHQTKVGQAGSHRLRDGSRAGGHRTIGAAGDVSAAAAASSIRASFRADSRSAVITAKGLAGLFFRTLNCVTTPSWSARQARWKPPIPLIARIFPARTASAAASRTPTTPARSPGKRWSAHGIVCPADRDTPLHRRRTSESAPLWWPAGHTADRRSPCSGPAVGAGDKGMAEPAVSRISHLTQAVRADRYIRWHQSPGVVAA